MKYKKYCKCSRKIWTEKDVGLLCPWCYGIIELPKSPKQLKLSKIAKKAKRDARGRFYQSFENWINGYEVTKAEHPFKWEIKDKLVVKTGKETGYKYLKEKEVKKHIDTLEQRVKDLEEKVKEFEIVIDIHGQDLTDIRNSKLESPKLEREELREKIENLLAHQSQFYRQPNNVVSLTNQILSLIK
jgi:hypothetical protein